MSVVQFRPWPPFNQRFTRHNPLKYQLVTRISAFLRVFVWFRTVQYSPVQEGGYSDGHLSDSHLEAVSAMDTTATKQGGRRLHSVLSDRAVKAAKVPTPSATRPKPLTSEQMSTWHRHRAQRNSRASTIAPPGGEGWTIRDHRAILHSEPYASADLGAASDVTATSVQSEAASASSPSPISLQLTSDVIAGMRGTRLLWQAASAQGETTTRPRRTRWDDSALVRFDRHSQFTRAVRQITAHFHSHQQTVNRPAAPPVTGLR